MSDTARTAPFTGAPLPDPDDDLPEPPRLRALRRLVTGLTVTLIAGVVIITGALVVRISGGAPTTAPLDPALITVDGLTVPNGARITAAGGSGSTVMLVTQADDGTEHLHLYDGATGALLRSLALTRAPR